MPRRIVLEDEIKLAEAVLKTEPDHVWTLIVRTMTPLYLDIMKRAARNGRPPISHYLNDILTAHFATEATGGLELDAREADTLAALCKVWKCDPKDAVQKVFSMTATQLLKEELQAEREHQQLVNKAGIK